MAKVGISEERKKTIIGIVNTNDMTVEIEDKTFSIQTLLEEYDGMDIKIIVGNKKEELEHIETEVNSINDEEE